MLVDYDEHHDVLTAMVEKSDDFYGDDLENCITEFKDIRTDKTVGYQVLGLKKFFETICKK